MRNSMGGFSRTYRIPKRIIILFFVMIINIFNYADRQIMGIVLVKLFDEHTMKKQSSFIQSAFFMGYFCTQILGGYMAFKCGGKFVLLIGVFWCIIFDFLTYEILISEPKSLLLPLARVGMGLGQGVILPTIHVLSAAWFPTFERSFFISMITGGQDLGAIFAFIESYLFDWKYIYWSIISCGTVWLILFAWLGYSAPEYHPTINHKEIDHIVHNRGQYLRSAKIPWCEMISSVEVWAIIISHSVWNTGWYILLDWIPIYMREHYPDAGSNSALYLGLPWIASFLGVVFSGTIADYLLRDWRVPTVAVRKAMNTIGLLAPAIFLLLIRFNLGPPIIFLSCALFFGRFAISGFWCNMIDVAPAYAGAVMGLSNTFATIPGIGNYFIKEVLANSDEAWPIVWTTVAIGNILGALFYLIYATGDKIIEEEEIDLLMCEELVTTPDLPFWGRRKKNKFSMGRFKKNSNNISVKNYAGPF